MKNTKKFPILVFCFLSLIFICIILSDNRLFANDNDMVQKTIEVNGDQRLFYVHLPANYDNIKEKLPTVLIFHGTVADANKIKNYTQFNDFADKKGIVVVYPEYMGNWDWDLKPAEKSKEVAFTNKIIDTVINTYNVDKTRIYQTGYSSGAEISYILACTLSEKIAAFAPVAGNLRKSYADGCSTVKKPVPIMLVHGTSDPYEKWEGNIEKQMFSVDETLNFWKKRNICKEKTTEISFPHNNSDGNPTTATLYQNNSCTNGSEVSIIKIEGGGHTWPGSPSSLRIEKFLGSTNYDISANEQIWDFFSNHRLN